MATVLPRRRHSRATNPSPPQSPSQDAPISMIPRSMGSRRNVRSTTSLPATTQPSPSAGPSQLPTSEDGPNLDPSSNTVSSTSTSNSDVSASASASASSIPIGTPPTGDTTMAQPVHPNVKRALVNQKGSVSGTNLVGLGMTGTSSLPVTATIGGISSGMAGLGLNGVNLPQTGASKMAAAANRGKAGGIDGMPPVQANGEEEEDHPLSEKSLSARRYQTIHTMNRLFHLPNRWNLIRPLGQGAYGLVISVQDSLSGEPVAVKCITKVFDKVILARRALREITLLRHFGGHENLTGLIDLDYVWDGYNEIYLYMEPMEADLHQIIRSGQCLSNSHIQYFMYQLLRGMKYVHSANVIHRDLKPGNLLVNADCELKICDFGLARGFTPSTGEADQNADLKLTEYVATRWYRAPEVMLSNRRYTTAIDVWSMGCILAELLGGKPIFKGNDYVDQLNLILGVLGTPDSATLDKVSSEKAAAYIRSLPRSEPVPLQLILPEGDPSALDLLSCLLVFDPAERVDVPTALTHDYVSPYRDETDEPSCPEIFEKWEEVESLSTIQEMRAAITREINEFRNEVRSTEVYEEEEEEEEAEEEIEEEGDGTIQMGDLSTSPVSTTTNTPLFSPPKDSGRAADLGPGVSPQDTTVSLPRTAEPSYSPLSTRVPLSRASSRERGRSRDYRESAPSTPATALSTLSEDSFSAGPSTGRASRRSSGLSMTYAPGRRPASFLFSNPLGGGMTPMNPVAPLFNGTSVIGQGSGATVNGDGWARPRSRAPSATGEFARPLIRQLSTVGLDALGKASGGTIESGPLLSHGEVPPMSVSPSDAPPSEVPRNFSGPAVNEQA